MTRGIFGFVGTRCGYSKKYSVECGNGSGGGDNGDDNGIFSTSLN